jgi:hypothetical protein
LLPVSATATAGAWRFHLTSPTRIVDLAVLAGYQTAACYCPCKARRRRHLSRAPGASLRPLCDRPALCLAVRTGCKDRRDMAPMFHPHPLETWRDDASPHDTVYCCWTAMYVAPPADPCRQGCHARTLCNCCRRPGCIPFAAQTSRVWGGSMSTAPARVAWQHDSGVDAAWPRPPTV